MQTWKNVTKIEICAMLLEVFEFHNFCVNGI